MRLVLKVSILYIVLAGLLIVRVANLCDGNFDGCAERVSQSSRTKKTNEYIQRFRLLLIDNVHRDLPSPHSELLLGMVVGVDDFDKLPIFSEMLRKTGTVHVVVVSGYNVTLVFSFVIRLIGSFYKRGNFILALGCTLFYSLISGFEAPVVRAWFMGSVLMLGKFHGIKLNVFLVLIFTGLILLIINPAYLFSMSFTLSFCATLSLVMFDNLKLDRGLTGIKASFAQDLSSTLSVQLLVWPIIAFSFGTFSVVSPIINMLILWTVPLTTILGSFYVITSLLQISLISKLIAFIVFHPLDVFVRGVELFSTLPFASIDLKITKPILIIYYALVGVYLLRRKRKCSQQAP